MVQLKAWRLNFFSTVFYTVREVRRDKQSQRTLFYCYSRYKLLQCVKESTRAYLCQGPQRELRDDAALQKWYKHSPTSHSEHRVAAFWVDYRLRRGISVKRPQTLTHRCCRVRPVRFELSSSGPFRYKKFGICLRAVVRFTNSNVVAYVQIDNIPLSWDIQWLKSWE